MKLKCSKPQHRLYWVLDVNCPCVDEVVNDFIQIGCKVQQSSDLANQLYIKYPWLEEQFPRDRIRHVFLEMLDRDEI